MQNNTRWFNNILSAIGSSECQQDFDLIKRAKHPLALSEIKLWTVLMLLKVNNLRLGFLSWNIDKENNYGYFIFQMQAPLKDFLIYKICTVFWMSDFISIQGFRMRKILLPRFCISYSVQSNSLALVMVMQLAW